MIIYFRIYLHDCMVLQCLALSNIPVELNPAYENPRNFLRQHDSPRNINNTIIIDVNQNPSYSLVKIT